MRELAKYKTLDDFNVKNKVVLVRVDFNSEIDPNTKKVTSDVRIKAHAESTLKELAEKGARTVVLAHQGRKGDPDFTPLKQHAEILGKILKCPVKYVDDVFGDKRIAAAEVARTLAAAQAAGCEPVSIDYGQRDLEQLFMQLTSRSLRE